MRLHIVVLVIAVTLAVSACGAAGVVSPPPPSQRPTITASHDDPTDAMADAGTAYEIVRVETRRMDTSPFGSYDTLRTDVTFAQPPVLPDPGAYAIGGTQLVFRVYFDTEQNDETGAWWNSLCGDDQGGAEFVVNATIATDVPPGLPVPAPRQPNGTYEVVDGTQKTGEASVAVDGTTLQVSVPLSALGNDDGVTHLSVRVGNASDPTTDCAPNAAGFIVTGHTAATR